MPDTTRLLLNSPLGSDPFKRTDFVENWDTLDANPGIYICTSTSRPNGWLAAQNGRKIYETDTKRILNWTYPSWQVIEQYTRGTGMAQSPNEYLGKEVKATYVLNGAYNAPRACRLMIMGAARFSQEAAKPQSVLVQPWVDGASVDVNTSTPNILRFADAGTGAAGSAQYAIAVWGLKAVTAGNHSIAVHMEIGSFADKLYVNDIRLLVLHVE
jgi:hypothetical protein